MRRIWKAQEDAVIDLSGAGDLLRLHGERTART
jgi:hypothetical protein